MPAETNQPTCRHIIKAILIQRIVPDYRIPIFQRLSCHDSSVEWEFCCTREGFLCRGLTSSARIRELKATRFRGIARSIRVGADSSPFVWWPGLLAHLFRRTPDVVVTEGNSNLPNNFAVALYCWLFRKPYVWWGLGTVRKPRPTFWRRTFGRLLDAFYRRAAAIVAYNSYAQEFFVSRGAAPEKVFVAQNTIDDREVRRQMERYRPNVEDAARRLGLGRGPRVLFIGRLTPAKRLDVLIKAFAIVEKEVRPKPDLLVVGDGPVLEDVRSLVCELGISERVFLVGRHVQDASLYVMMADLAVLPGLGGLAMNHAFAHGLPVVCGETDGGERDLIRNGINGILMEDGVSAESLAEVLGPLLRDRKRLANMKREAGKTLLLKASPKAMLDTIVRAARVASENSVPRQSKPSR